MQVPVFMEETHFDIIYKGSAPYEESKHDQALYVL